MTTMNLARLEAQMAELLSDDLAAVGEPSDPEPDYTDDIGPIQSVTLSPTGVATELHAIVWDQYPPLHSIMGMRSLRKQMKANGQWGDLRPRTRAVVDIYCNLRYSD